MHALSVASLQMMMKKNRGIDGVQKMYALGSQILSSSTLLSRSLFSLATLPFIIPYSCEHMSARPILKSIAPV